ncbi:Ig-like group 1 domain-containing protein [Herbaspirillum sp. HC18]|nr:Ig-like group 1 domain-containing protein [Herbaspirillum sp. HC18]
MKSGVTRDSFKDIVRYALSIILMLAVAACGGGGGSPGKVSGTSGTGVGSVSLIFSSSELKSAGTAGGEVTITALVKDGNNAALSDIPVTFNASSGALVVTDAKSDKNGQAKATLGTSGDRTNRRITVTVQAGGKSANGTVDVVNTSVTIAGPNTVTAGGVGDFTITVKDSSNVAVPNVPVTFSSLKGNSIVVKTSNGGSSTAPLTNSQGQVVIGVTASQAGADTILASSQGASYSVTMNVNAAKLTVALVDGSGNVVSTGATSTTCQRIAARYEVNGAPQNGTVNISTSRGKIYSDSSCLTLVPSGSAPVVNGDSQAVYLKSDNAGFATVTASIANGPSAQTSMKFIAPLTAFATISVQADPAVIGANSGTSQIERSNLTAIVRDGTVFNNLVEGAVVEFSLITDKSGGSLSNPSVVTTGSNGAASVVFIAGAADTSKDGVVVQARIQGTTITTTTNLTVSKKSLFISAGTGNKLTPVGDTLYQQDYSVFVTDASGNPVSNVAVTAAIVPTRYKKGFYAYDPITVKAWDPQDIDICANEDINQDGILDPGEDANSNGRLDPGIPLNVSSSGTTDATGTAKISILYPRDRAHWTEVKLTIKGTVSGTESTYQVPVYWLLLLTEDLTNEKSDPPGKYSPYGVNVCSSPN